MKNSNVGFYRSKKKSWFILDWMHFRASGPHRVVGKRLRYARWSTTSCVCTDDLSVLIGCGEGGAKAKDGT